MELSSREAEMMTGPRLPVALPDDFLFGVATAGFQVEGGFNGPGEPANNWERWERSGRIEPSGNACDFWREPEVALDRAAAIGCNAFRLSVEWARLEPVEGDFDTEALHGYRRILDGCHERGLEPIVTLHHFTHPDWLGEEFWLEDDAPDRFSAHVARVLPALVPRCRRWITINEPNIVALMGWIQGDCPPGRRMAVPEAFTVLDHLLTAHVLAYREIHAAQTDAEVTVNTSSSSIYEHDRMLTDLLTVRSAGVERDRVDAYLDDRRDRHDSLFPPAGRGEAMLRRLFTASSPYGAPMRPGRTAPVRSRLRRPSRRRVLDAVYGGPDERPLDTTGFDWYDPVASHALRLPGHRSSGGRRFEPSRALWDVPPDPEAMARWCHDQHSLLSDLPLWIVENGLCSRVRNGRSYPRTDGWDRPRYLREHVASVVDAVAATCPVRAYLHWSLVDNYEWGSYEPRFGIFGIDRARGPRGFRWLETDAQGRDSAGAYRALISWAREGAHGDPPGP
ncbi:MAG: family 1 glycosylhydrolase [Acidimicrobiales bacterium]